MAGHSKFKVVGDRHGSDYKALLGHFFGTIMSLPRGKLLLASWAAGAVLSLGFGRLGRQLTRAAGQAIRTPDNKQQAPPGSSGSSGGQAGRPPSLWAVLRAVGPQALPGVTTTGSAWLAFHTACLVARALLTVKMARITGS